MDSQTALGSANQPHQQASSISHTADEVYQLAQTQGFALLDEAIDAQRLKDMLQDEQCGALATFEGWVRNHNNDSRVTSLTYYGYEKLAINQGKLIVEEAKRLFDIQNAVAIHRIGALEIGDMAVWVGVSSKHRYPAFDACKWILDTIKADIPVWKQEYYQDQSSKWLSNNG
ncbi:molybdenum cofactor biosynthesis protein MoaE [Psychrobacter phenylpyruvicus]|uniref:Molybdopterin synthase catalytic subunit n=1 Tax=Psychrobacter phenylpyruvicus TaxID=29432 RepID=A0A379LMH8_9GAMM|nr:molybdenum cofactor biosynthesis protein MoaE [Psychrobacter phenylpyruvicus]SUD91816.1 Molybdopterin synthase catalytic subunit [Psychrobacter phenylpyruvicus]SUD98915.1 Molybdopterin synthase catalytic subunit [Psychrobacter phenylpyruvicus]